MLTALQYISSQGSLLLNPMRVSSHTQTKHSNKKKSPPRQQLESNHFLQITSSPFPIRGLMTSPSPSSSRRPRCFPTCSRKSLSAANSRCMRLLNPAGARTSASRAINNPNPACPCSDGAGWGSGEGAVCWWRRRSWWSWRWRSSFSFARARIVWVEGFESGVVGAIVGGCWVMMGAGSLGGWRWRDSSYVGGGRSSGSEKWVLPCVSVCG